MFLHLGLLSELGFGELFENRMSHKATGVDVLESDGKEAPPANVPHSTSAFVWVWVGYQERTEPMRLSLGLREANAPFSGNSRLLREAWVGRLIPTRQGITSFNPFSSVVATCQLNLRLERAPSLLKWTT